MSLMKPRYSSDPSLDPAVLPTLSSRGCRSVDPAARLMKPRYSSVPSMAKASGCTAEATSRTALGLVGLPWVMPSTCTEHSTGCPAHKQIKTGKQWASR